MATYKLTGCGGLIRQAQILVTWQVLVFGQVEQVKTIGKNHFNYEGV